MLHHVSSTTISGGVITDDITKSHSSLSLKLLSTHESHESIDNYLAPSLINYKDSFEQENIVPIQISEKTKKVSKRKAALVEQDDSSRVLAQLDGNSMEAVIDTDDMPQKISSRSNSIARPTRIRSTRNH